MKSKQDRAIPRAQKPTNSQGQGPNWVLIAGGALLSTLSLRLGYKLKQVLETKRPDNACSLKGKGKSTVKRRSGACPLHSNIYCFTENEDGCYHCISGVSEGMVESKRLPTSPMSKEAELALPLVTIPAPESSRENGVIWASSPDRLELPQKPFHRSNSSDSPCMSESGSDIYSKREVIQKLRQQLKRRDEMILEMQAQIMDLQNSLSMQVAQSTHMQSQVDSANHELFESEREIQRLRKAIADHCVGGMGSPEERVATGNWQAEPVNGHVNGFHDSPNDIDSKCSAANRRRIGDEERIEMLKREVGELKEVMEGKDFLLRSYKEQKTELCSKINELQLGLASQVPSIL